MKTGKEHKPTGSIHRQQLFYWMGCSIDSKNRGRKVLRDDLVGEVLTQLRGSLEHGLWVRTPRYPEQLELRGRTFALSLPIACFTEWSLGEGLPHTTEYGRIGFGFPKRWVIEHGGQSVTYFRHAQTSPFLRAAFQLLRAVGRELGDGRWEPQPNTHGFAELVYLLHFAKMIRLKREVESRKQDKSLRRRAPVVAAKPAPTQATVEAQTFKRRFGHPLPFVEEREWRIVYHPAIKGFVPGPGTPAHYLPYLPGDDLFTLVLPDNKVVSRVLEDDWFTQRLFTPWKHFPALKGRRVPPVTVLAHSDLGTF